MSPIAIGTRRRLVFENVANGVPREAIMAAFLLSEAELDADFKFVGQKIAEYRFRRVQPPLRWETYLDLCLNRAALLDNLRRLGDNALSTALIIPKIGVHNVENVAQCREAARKVRAS